MKGKALKQTMNVMDWDANNCPPNFCRASNTRWGHQSIHWKHAPFLSFFMLGLQAHRQVSVPVIHGGWFAGGQQLFKSSPGCPPPLHLQLQLSLRPAYPVDAGSTSSQTEPEPAQRAAGHFTGYIRTRHKFFHLCTVPPASPLCPVPTQRVISNICTSLPGK